MQSITIFFTAFVSPFLLIFHTHVQEKVYRHLLGNKYETLTHSSIDTQRKHLTHTCKFTLTLEQIHNTLTWSSTNSNTLKHSWTLSDRHKHADTHIYTCLDIYTHTPLTHIPIHKERQQAQPATHINSESTHLETVTST